MEVEGFLEAELNNLKSCFIIKILEVLSLVQEENLANIF